MSRKTEQLLDEIRELPPNARADIEASLLAVLRKILPGTVAFLAARQILLGDSV
jgi:hypothetical protein